MFLLFTAVSLGTRRMSGTNVLSEYPSVNKVVNTLKSLNSVQFPIWQWYVKLRAIKMNSRDFPGSPVADSKLPL